MRKPEGQEMAMELQRVELSTAVQRREPVQRWKGVEEEKEETREERLREL